MSRSPEPYPAPDRPEVYEVVVTAGDGEELAALTRSLVEAGLAACGQIIAPVRSIYRWQGAVEDGTEARVALHTGASRLAELMERVGRDHPYEVPCVIALPVLDGHPAYLRWVEEQTRPR